MPEGWKYWVVCFILAISVVFVIPIFLMEVRVSMDIGSPKDSYSCEITNLSNWEKLTTLQKKQLIGKELCINATIVNVDDACLPTLKWFKFTLKTDSAYIGARVTAKGVDDDVLKLGVGDRVYVQGVIDDIGIVIYLKDVRIQRLE